MFPAGAEVKPGCTHGALDEFGLKAVEGRMHTNDLHAALLAIVGLDHGRFTYSGRMGPPEIKACF